MRFWKPPSGEQQVSTATVVALDFGRIFGRLVPNDTVEIAIVVTTWISAGDHQVGDELLAETFPYLRKDEESFELYRREVAITFRKAECHHNLFHIGFELHELAVQHSEHFIRLRCIKQARQQPGILAGRSQFARGGGLMRRYLAVHIHEEHFAILRHVANEIGCVPLIFAAQAIDVHDPPIEDLKLEIAAGKLFGEPVIRERFDVGELRSGRCGRLATENGSDNGMERHDLSPRVNELQFKTVSYIL
jgi:hypothetical protein